MDNKVIAEFAKAGTISSIWKTGHGMKLMVPAVERKAVDAKEPKGKRFRYVLIGYAVRFIPYVCRYEQLPVEMIVMLIKMFGRSMDKSVFLLLFVCLCVISFSVAPLFGCGSVLRDRERGGGGAGNGVLVYGLRQGQRGA